MDTFRAFCATEKGDLGRVQELVNSSNIDAKTLEGWTVLHSACRWGHDHIAAWLLRFGANVNARTRTELTPLHFAASYSHAKCIKLLLLFGADASLTNTNERVPLHNVYESAECASLLLSAYPFGMNVVDDLGRTPLHEAAMLGPTVVCCVLLDGGSIIDTLDKFGRTPLCCALCCNKRYAAEVLLDHGARLDLVKLDIYLKSIPEWAVSFFARRNACRTSCWAILELVKRRSRDVRGNGRDALGLVARAVWKLRKEEAWIK